MKTVVSALALAALAVTGAAQAEMMVRVRAIDILPDAKSSPVTGVDVSNKVAPDVDISWLFSSHFATELLLTIPQSHKVTLNGTDIGRAAHLPPTLLLQYRVPAMGAVEPYLGAGLNYTFFTDRKLNGGLELERGSFGPALQAGFDVKLSDGWYANVDVKKIWIDTDVTSGGAFVTHVEINPLVIGIGLGRRF
ncbi:MAG TPA: OmpW family outer membrane protein [Nevskiaceae bacterium]|nr:OmpW family outer membrane protein [Nevskiaceae bacterium]